ncbi:response regulator transcription factor [Montanilutibacter psychrotolerans]|uniref:DNA-binding response regulator n=1 Tax=Montanilutibacter psychrotolerans TaxID=1327343 RepID=A0A3M8SX18_9GAMM|nr:response regulator transcription factor [Lysobacter psychrotolerans]RNF85225.1 DNA-binding response regulator [Lysobacter psychrotolerans]
MRILIADDHPIICIALSEMLKTAFPGEGTSIETASDSDSLLAAIQARSFDLLVLDLQMPGELKSVTLLEAVVAMRPDLKIVIYTGYAHPSLALATSDLGARAHVLKASGPHLAIDAIRAVLAGGAFVDPAIDLESARSHPWHQLTSGERKVLLALARGENLQVIAIDTCRSYKTVTTHKYNALSKLGLRSNAEIGPYLSAHGLDYLID